MEDAFDRVCSRLIITRNAIGPTRECEEERWPSLLCLTFSVHELVVERLCGFFFKERSLMAPSAGSEKLPNGGSETAESSCGI
jgi:hypothetical protein